MPKFEPYFHVDSYDLAKALMSSGQYLDNTCEDVRNMLCEFFDIDYNSLTTQIKYTGYDDILERIGPQKGMRLARDIVGKLHRDNVNVLKYTDTFCITF